MSLTQIANVCMILLLLLRCGFIVLFFSFLALAVTLVTLYRFGFFPFTLETPFFSEQTQCVCVRLFYIHFFVFFLNCCTINSSRQRAEKKTKKNAVINLLFRF